MKKVIALSALPLTLLFAVAFQSNNSVPGQLAAIQSQLNTLQAQVASLATSFTGRKFYLTKTPYDGAHALSACATGYHMASLWEIHEPSNLAYDTTIGLTLADSGFGPPSATFGWMRTGYFAFSTLVSGFANCQAWTSASGTELGSGAFLDGNWNSTPRTVSPWVGNSFTCDLHFPVWCVQD